MGIITFTSESKRVKIKMRRVSSSSSSSVRDKLSLSLSMCVYIEVAAYISVIGSLNFSEKHVSLHFNVTNLSFLPYAYEVVLRKSGF